MLFTTSANNTDRIQDMEKKSIDVLKTVGIKQGIDGSVFDFLENKYFKDFINKTFIGGGSSALKGKKVEEIHLKATSDAIKNLNLNTNQSFLNIVGLSGSGKSEIRKRLPKDALYFPLDERLKVFLNMDEIKYINVFLEDGKFDAKKFEYAMYCAAFMSGKYNNSIIDHSGGSPLQPGLQALAEGLAGKQNETIHLNVDAEVISYNIAHNVLYDNWQSLKEPVRDAIGIAMGYVKKGYEKEDPARIQLVKHEKDDSDILGNLRKRYKEFCDNNKYLNSTAEWINNFKKTLSTGKDLEILSLHREKAMDYVKQNEWRRPQFSVFSPRTKNCSCVDIAAKLANDYIRRYERFNTVISGIPSDILQYENLVPTENDIDTYLFDMHGVIHSGGPISRETLEYFEYLKKCGKNIIIASNDTDFGENYIKNIALKGLEQGKHFDFAVTSGDVLKSMIDTGFIEKEIAKNKNINGRKIKIFVLDNLKNLDIFCGKNAEKFELVYDINDADVVITGTPKKYNNERFSVEEKSLFLTEHRKSILDKIVQNRLTVIVPNPDRKTPFEQHIQTIGSGRFGKICSQNNNISVIMTGKPSKYFYDYLKDKMVSNNIVYNPSRTAMIGDSFATDMVGGRIAGFKTIAVVNDKSNIGLTLSKNSNSFRERISKQPEAKPDFVVKDI